MFPARPAYTVAFPGGAIQLGSRCLVMGILNVTPDSFAASGPFASDDEAANAAVRLEAAGADIIDIGGESTRPGAEPITAREELARVLPVLERLRGRISVPISIDTSKADVARAALSAGASIVNDVTGLQGDPAMARTVGAAGAALVLMHMRGTPKTMAAEAVYGDVVTDVTSELGAAIARAVAGGVARDRIIVDPGIGFAKRAAHSYGVLARLADIGAALERPVLVGPSRKSFMAAALGEVPPAERDWGTAAAVTACVLAGAHIVRVHAVEEMIQVVRVAEELRKHAMTRVTEQP
jgi:dihydropteroate synthase